MGTPDAALLDSEGNLADYLTESTARAPNFNNILALQPGEFAYVSEAFFQSPEYGFPGFTRRRKKHILAHNILVRIQYQLIDGMASRQPYKRQEIASANVFQAVS